MAQFTEVLAAQTKQSRAIELCVSADVVVGVRVKFAALAVGPDFSCLITGVQVNRRGTPVFLFSRHVAAAFQQKNALASGRQFGGQGSASGPGSDDDDVVVIIRH